VMEPSCKGAQAKEIASRVSRAKDDLIDFIENG
jgi:hypothetical protein